MFITTHSQKYLIVSSCLVLSVLLAGFESAQAGIISTPGLTTVRVWEVTGIPVQHNLPSSGPAMTAQLGLGILGPSTNDFNGLSNENFDVFYSDANGAFNVNGNYVTVEAVFPSPNSGGGLNLAAVDLLIGSSVVRADILTSWVGLGPNYISGSEILAVDADSPVPATFTTMGSTVIPPAAHLRVTVGWSKVPEPSSVCLVGVTLLMSVVGTRCRRAAA